LRQVYDDWQDQPGNYYPIVTKVLIPSRELSLGHQSTHSLTGAFPWLEFITISLKATKARQLSTAF